MPRAGGTDHDSAESSGLFPIRTQISVCCEPPRRAEDCERAVRRWEGLTAREQAVRHEELEVLLDLEQRRMHQRDHLRRNPGLGENFALPFAVTVQVRDLGKKLVVGAVQIERRAGKRNEFGSEAHVVRVNMGEQDPANVFPVHSQALHGAGERLEAGVCLHAAVDQQVAGVEAHEVDVDEAQRERERQFQQMDTGDHLAIIAADFKIGGQGVILAQRGEFKRRQHGRGCNLAAHGRGS